MAKTISRACLLLAGTWSTLHQGQALTWVSATGTGLIIWEAYRPCYEGLTNNVSTRLMKLKINSWPPGTADFVNHRVLNEYIQDTSYKTGVHLKTKYNTRVEKVFKSGQDWKMQTSTLTRDQGAFHRVERDWVGFQLPLEYRKLRILQTFDAVIIASGHYHACRIPDISGLAAWKKRWPSRVQHSKSYRHPRNFRDQVCMPESLRAARPILEIHWSKLAGRTFF